MNVVNIDRAKGKVDEVKGTVREAIGKATKDDARRETSKNRTG